MVEGERRNDEPIMSSVEDMRVLVDESADQRDRGEEKEMILRDGPQRGRRTIMAPRSISWWPETATRSELIAKFVDGGYTRLRFTGN